MEFNYSYIKKLKFLKKFATTSNEAFNGSLKLLYQINENDSDKSNNLHNNNRKSYTYEGAQTKMQNWFNCAATALFGVTPYSKNIDFFSQELVSLYLLDSSFSIYDTDAKNFPILIRTLLEKLASECGLELTRLEYNRYMPCPTNKNEWNIALYCDYSNKDYHFLRQLPDGRWLSKIGWTNTYTIENSLPKIFNEYVFVDVYCVTPTKSSSKSEQSSINIDEGRSAEL